MTRYTAQTSTNGVSFFTVRMSELNKERKQRRRALTWAAMWSYFNGRTLQNSATSSFMAIALPTLTVVAYG